ncbi:UDP-N-acetylglucosamine--N-acetylmuramyl-(pentapeptide) pyrophosphoryl-undecaprenol N-acetylglucosamine transferase [Candidatus Babeliales bacterium]|nr:UDP-N-acetylglucosamine--N-acetylmuramyl-(pentapeptide) pyrophosphoryl-undecaprenol N-acetylglucosamine transferase [Candidatus Babeliales bacterium]MCF7899336.1 UDP-N-acetylglucosamine--N-acetylmuramyl-(pentapeptide) pyrophosphoryl-undecaprenol N-acetylglucosamine transferase [Candidatus Babeliales bacterium]
MKKKNLFLVAGGSGGHILPALQLGKKWKEKNLDGKIIFVSNNSNLEKKILENNNFLDKIIYLNFKNVPGKKFWLYPVFLYFLILTFFKNFYYLTKFKPKEIISTGGYFAIPTCILSRLFKTKINLYELNFMPGKAIKFLSSFADNIFIVFEQTRVFFKKESHKCLLCNYPIRFELKDKIFDKNLILKKLNFSSDKKTIFLLGGSQGSVYLNNLLKNSILNNLSNLKNKVQIIHQTGVFDKTDWQNFYKNLNIPAIIFSYKHEIKDYYLISDLVIARAGAGTLFELEFFQKKSFIIPLQTSYTDHQYDNAINISERNNELFIVKTEKEVCKSTNFFLENLF